MVLTQKQRNKIIDGIKKGLFPKIYPVTGKGKLYDMIYVGMKSTGAASEVNLKQVDAILVKHGLKPMFYPPTPVVLIPTVELKPSNETGTEGIKTEIKTSTEINPQEPVVQETPTTVQPPPATPPPVITQPLPSSVDPPSPDNQIIEMAMGLSDADQIKRYQDKGMLTGTVPAIGVVTKIVSDAEWGFKVTAELGRVIMYESMKHLTLDDEERSKHELAVKKIEKWIHELVVMKYHAEILEEVLLANEVAKGAIHELQNYASVSALAYETVTNVLCDRCRRRAMWALAIKSSGGEQMLEKEEVISK